MKRKLKKAISLMLAVVMVMTLMPVVAKKEAAQVQAATQIKYNADAAVAYAKAHWGDIPQYPNGDCTNFVSYCLQAGGLPTDEYFGPHATKLIDGNMAQTWGPSLISYKENLVGSGKASSSIVRIKKPSTVKVKGKTNGIKITWTKTSGAKGYIVYRKINGSKTWKKIAAMKGIKKVSYLDRKVKQGKSYTYRIKAYNGKSYSAVKTSKNVKMK